MIEEVRKKVEPAEKPLPSDTLAAAGF